MNHKLLFLPLALLLVLVPILLVLAPTLSVSVYAATSRIRSCEDNHSCVVTFKNGKQWVQLSTPKWNCIIKTMHTIVNVLTHNSLIDSIAENAGLGICLKYG